VALGHPSESVDAEAIPQYIMDYFQHCRALNVEIQGDAAEQIEQHYLQERQSAQKLDANHLSRVLNIARLMAACDGCNNYLNMDHYLAALELTKSS
jgi:DNA replicative helicase MCM subunit Mcm2 (Cdc46/Mcm family)